MPFYPPLHAFFQEAIEEFYNKDASFPIYLKKLITSVHGLRCPIEWE